MNSTNDIPLPADQLRHLNDELEPGEHLIWVGHPIPRYCTPKSVTAFLFGLFFLVLYLGIAIHLFNKEGSSDGTVPIVCIFFAVVLAVSVWLLCVPKIIHRKHLRTVYALTDRKAIVLLPIIKFINFKYDHNTYPLAPDMVIKRREKQDGGDLVFERKVSHCIHGIPVTYPVGFVDIPSLKRVENMLSLAIFAASGK